MQQGRGSHPYRSRLRADSNFFFELQFCNEHGIPHSKFLSWSEDDRAKALAFIIEKADRCAMCGTASWEWDPAQGGDRRAYEPVVSQCPGCYIKESMAETAEHRPGQSIELVTSKGVEAARRYVREKEAWMRRGHDD